MSKVYGVYRKSSRIVCHSLRSILLRFAIGVAVVRVSGSHALEVGLISQPDPLVHNLSLPFFVGVGLACETEEDNH